MSKGIGKEFMEKTKYKYLEESDQDKGLPQPPLELGYEANSVLIDLPPVENINIKSIDLRKVIESRKSLRKYSKTALNIEELSYLLWSTQGVKQVVSRPATIRTVPSAGARHAIETYLLINKVDGINPGLYRYIALSHKLMEVNLDPEIDEKISNSCLRQDFIKNSAVTFIWTADVYRMKWRYGERGYRYLHLDAGHICQNLYLSAEAIDSGVCAIAAFDDDEINGLIGLDGENQFVLYVATLGKTIS
ncbi:SagB/ThcOx family dehydrogenase [Alkaliphilus sp. MSJ-5]|uniref:SagB/ThcOx family dehydrogenase n=1 Tax=Alkaliphilus flagellatus TaxID=2841507 RepID=A0ABS6G1P3_9FIRM|nr:SagB/ThcOx family dehydrogenase [Alkaliphilus flagellatus]MBU5675568.1 SagB/ThcOx family dehydrogenase [Alkaliphilus flagellatus]